MDNNELYCQQKIAIPGSACYYSALTLSAWQRSRVIALLAFSAEIQAVCLECHDQDVARAKLNFWYEELLALNRNNATHPVTLQLQSLFVQQSPPYVALLAIVYEAQVRLHTPWLSMASDTGHVQRYHGIWEILSTHVFDEGHAAEIKDFMAKMASYLGRVHVLEHCSEYMQKNLHYFVSTQENNSLAQLAQNAAFIEELRMFLTETVGLLEQACAALPQKYRSSQRFIIILAQLLRLRVDRLSAASTATIVKNLQQGRLLAPLPPIYNYYYARKYYKQEQRIAGDTPL